MLPGTSDSRLVRREKNTARDPKLARDQCAGKAMPIDPPPPDERGVPRFVSRSVAHIGPLPPPEILHDYETIHPGLAERIIRMAEQEAAQRHAMESKAIDAQVEDLTSSRAQIKRGQIFGLVICLTAILSGAIVAGLGKQWAGAAIGAGGLAGLVTAFIVGRRDEVPAEPTISTERTSAPK